MMDFEPKHLMKVQVGNILL